MVFVGAACGRPYTCEEGIVEKICNQIDELLAKVDFEAIWPGFVPCDYVLFANDKAYMKGKEIPMDGLWGANVAQEYEGRQIATWNLQNSENPDLELTVCGIVHEMFHAFQNNSGETRHANEFALFAYPRDLDNIRLKLAENHYLVKAFTENSLVDLEQFVVLRKARRRIIGEAAMHQEQLSETKEGMAEFAGLMALSQISRPKFVEYAEKIIGHLRDAERLLLPRYISYSVGCMMCLVMKANGIDFYHDLTDVRTVFELLPDKVGQVEKIFNKHVVELEAKFAHLRENYSEKVECDTKIGGFNPMAMTRLEDEIYCDYGVHLQNGVDTNEPTLLIMEAGELNKVKAYIR